MSTPSASVESTPSTPTRFLGLSLGKLSMCKHIDEREVGLRKLREVAKEMERKAVEAEAELAEQEQVYEEFLKEVEETYEDDAEGIAWFRKQSTWTEELVELQQKLEKAQQEFEVDKADYEKEKNELRTKLQKAEERVDKLKKKQVVGNRKGAIATVGSILGRK